MVRTTAAFLAAFLFLAQPLCAQAPPSPATPPKLLVVIAIDQFSADLFAEYRQHYSGGLKRLANGVVFPSGYQSHVATETCPGHATILTGSRPARTGIIANEWIDLGLTREDKTIYCVEDERVPGSTHATGKYTVSPIHLRVPTLGDRMKLANPAARSVSVAGKDRSAVTMGGHHPDAIWWWEGDRFASYAGRSNPAVDMVNAGIARQKAAGHAAMDIPSYCVGKDWPVLLANGRTVGTGRFVRAAGATIRETPEKDAITLALATGLIETMQLGSQAQTDVIDIGLSATDHVGHAFGTGGLEMCIHQAELDKMLGEFFARLDAQGLDYLVALTADHGGHDIPERQRLNGVPDEARVEAALTAESMDAALVADTGIKGPLIHGTDPFGDFWFSKSLSAAEHQRVQAAALTKFRSHPQVAAVFTRAELAAAPAPAGPADSWTLLQQARASFTPERSGDLVVVLTQRVTPIIKLTGTIATHGFAGPSNRRVPILFWRKGLTPFEQPASVETVDIMPSLARLIGLSVPPEEIDGRCLDIYAGPADSCR